LQLKLSERLWVLKKKTVVKIKVLLQRKRKKEKEKHLGFEEEKGCED
jgi:hypothetical protein